MLGAVLLLALVGCEGGSTPPAGDDAASSASAPATSTPARDDAAASSTIAVLSEPVSVTTTTALTPARRLEVTGRTNLPDRTRLLVELERSASGVSWQSRTEVRDGAFAVGPLGPGSGLVAGRYQIRVSMPVADVQPTPVKNRIGTRGEHLTGPLVARSPHGLGNVIDYRRDYLFDE
ncbi:hypothetical protein [Halomonas sp. YLGW01]|uniref:hypothetical protein n=1 Tax=Halomonas sp. YLGW01 TaxID=2773308 RepID=UPI001783DE48|nr:hypothetical protein [Halomonas sp. YLGW01]